MDRQNFILGVKKFILMLLQAGKSQDLERAPSVRKVPLLRIAYIKLYETFSNFALCSRTTFLSKSMSAKADSILSA